MQEWKLEIVKKLDEKSEELREIRFYDVAREMGYNHIKVNYVKDIATRFLKEHPTYKAVRFVKNPKRSLLPRVFSLHWCLPNVNTRPRKSSLRKLAFPEMPLQKPRENIATRHMIGWSYPCRKA